MKTFKEFNQSDGVACPVCKTTKNVETVLVPNPEYDEDEIMECLQVHKKCFDLMIEMMDGEEVESLEIKPD
jgi:hypothetical protein